MKPPRIGMSRKQLLRSTIYHAGKEMIRYIPVPKPQVLAESASAAAILVYHAK